MNTPKTSPLPSSPLPWRVNASACSIKIDSYDPYNPDKARYGIAAVFPFDAYPISEQEADANARLIVESVNGRPALLSRIEALERALRVIEGKAAERIMREIAHAALEAKL